MDQARLQEVLDYDPSTGIFRWRHRADVSKQWNSRFAGRVTGYKDRKGYLVIVFEGRRWFAHRLAWLYMTGEWPEDEIDHRNGQRDGNWFSNLRNANDLQTAANAGMRRDNTSGVKGVHWAKRRGLWHAQISHGGRRISLGFYETKEAAAKTYQQAAMAVHGQFFRAT